MPRVRGRQRCLYERQGTARVAAPGPGRVTPAPRPGPAHRHSATDPASSASTERANSAPSRSRSGREPKVRLSKTFRRWLPDSRPASPVCAETKKGTQMQVVSVRTTSHNQVSAPPSASPVRVSHRLDSSYTAESEIQRVSNQIQQDLDAKIAALAASSNGPSQQDIENIQRRMNELQNAADPYGLRSSAPPAPGVGANAPVSLAAGNSGPGNGPTRLPSAGISHLPSVVRRNFSAFI